MKHVSRWTAGDGGAYSPSPRGAGQVLKKTGRDRLTPSAAVRLQDGRTAPLRTLPAAISSSEFRIIFCLSFMREIMNSGYVAVVLNVPGSCYELHFKVPAVRRDFDISWILVDVTAQSRRRS